MTCEACERGDHDQCGMQTWCDCDCEGPDGLYLPEGYYFRDDLDGGRLVKKDEQEPTTPARRQKEDGCGPRDELSLPER
jgi:hypothetical protein